MKVTKQHKEHVERLAEKGFKGLLPPYPSYYPARYEQPEHVARQDGNRVA